jgi:ribonuclease HI
VRGFRIPHAPERDADGIVLSPEQRDAETLVIFTDGSYYRDAGTQIEHAGAASIFLRVNTETQTLVPSYMPKWGKVITDQQAMNFHGARTKTNNTGELQAIADAVNHVLHNNDLFAQYKKVLICTDSQIALRQLTGYDRNNTNWEMVKCTQILLNRLMRPEGADIAVAGLAPRKVEFMKVEAHADNYWNNWVDIFAKGSIGTQRVNLLTQCHNFHQQYPFLEHNPDTVIGEMLADPVLATIYQEGAAVAVQEGAGE